MSALAGISGDVWLSTSPPTALGSSEIFIDQGDQIHYWFNSTGPQKDAVSNSSNASASSLTWSHTVTNSQSNLILLVAVSVGSSATCTGVTYNSAAVTMLSSKTQGTQTVYLFYKVAPSTGANNIVATLSGAAPVIGLATSYYNVAQTSTFGTAASNSGTSGSSSNTVTTTVNTQIVLDINYANGTSSTPGLTQTIETSNTGVAPFYFADRGAVGTNLALAWTNAGSPTIWVEVGVAMNGAAGSGGNHQAWDPSQTFTVQTSPNGTGSWTTDSSGDYVMNWPVGEIVFTSARTVGTNNYVRVSAGSYFTLSALSGAHAWKMSGKGMTKDVTPFQAAGSWAVNLGITKSMTCSVDCYSQDARILNEMITTGGGTVINISGGLILVQLWWNESGGDRYQFYAFPTGITQTVVAQDVDKQAVTFQATGPIYQITSNTFSTTTVVLM
jgi:hypothetical protein